MARRGYDYARPVRRIFVALLVLVLLAVFVFWRIDSPRAEAALMVSSVWRQRRGALSFWVIENDTGILVFSATRSIIGRSSLMVERSSTN